ncbi:MAG: hypothetical protein PWP60_197 [Candidatus Atribacteria bacterium]|nr:hypothetical protein [Candidatus Atribacteria bacterium]MDI3530348.1 hypothetical protein [Candidatus Atribacteria bacterium]
MRLLRVFWLFFLLPLLERAAFAQDELELPEVAPPSFSGGVDVLRVALAFLFVILCLWGLYYFLRRFAREKPRLASSRYMVLLDFFPVSQKLSVYLFRVGERVIMLAQSGNTVREVAEFQMEELEEQKPTSSGFTSYLDLILGRRKND